MTDKKAIETAKALIDFCKEQSGCQNCVFRRYGASEWGCNLESFRFYFNEQEVNSNYNAKRRNGVSVQMRS